MPTLKTESEIATMSYIRERTSLPVPEVYYWESGQDNVLGCEYMLMQKVRFLFGRCQDKLGN